MFDAAWMSWEKGLIQFVNWQISGNGTVLEYIRPPFSRPQCTKSPNCRLHQRCKLLEYAAFCLSQVKSASCYYLVNVSEGFIMGMSVKAFSVPWCCSPVAM